MARGEVGQLWTVDAGGTLTVRPHPGQARAFRSQRRFVWMLAGTQGGKTAVGPLWLLREIQTRGAGDYLAVTATFPLLKLKMLPEFLRLFQHTLGLGTWHGTDKVFAFRAGVSAADGSPLDGTRVIFGSAANPESLESATANAAWLDEVGQDDFRLGSWEAILRRVALHRGRVLGGTTLYNLGWLKQQVYDAWRAGDPDHEVIQFASTANPAFPPEEYDRARRTLPEWKFNLFYRGAYDRPAGLIYAAFGDTSREDGGHLVPPFPLPPQWPRYGGIDFGAVNTAKVAVAHDTETNVYYLYREQLDGGKTTAEHAAEAATWAHGVNWVSWQGGAKSEVQQRRDWAAAGIRVREPKVADVESGLDRVIALFKTRRLYVFDSCRGVRDELGTYARVTDEQGNPTTAIKDKATYHRLDALRYLVQALDVPGTPTVAPIGTTGRSFWRIA